MKRLGHSNSSTERFSVSKGANRVPARSMIRPDRRAVSEAAARANIGAQTNENRHAWAARLRLSFRSWRVGLVTVIASTAIATCWWRTEAGHRFLPGLFTVICVPLSVAFFVVLDRVFRFRVGEWVAVSVVVAAHLVLSVPAFPGPLYYEGTHLIRPDHFVHLFAGGLVAWLCCEILEPRVSVETVANFGGGGRVSYDHGVRGGEGSN